MHFLSDDGLQQTVLLIVPGVIAALFYGLFVPHDRRNWSTQVLEVAAYGFVNCLLWYWAIDSAIADGGPNSIGRSAMLIGMLVVSPAALGAATAWVRRTKWFTRWARSPIPSAWDFTFSTRRPRWVRVHLKGGGMFGGLVDERSFATSHPQTQEFFVGEQWTLASDGTFIRRIPESAGVLIRAEDCRVIEFLEVKETKS